MTTGEKGLLLLAAVFAVLALMFMMYMPVNTLFSLPVGVFVTMYAAAGALFLLYVKFRKNQRAAFVCLWLLCVVFLIATVLFIAANMYAVR